MGTVNDPAHEWTDERLRDLERAMRDEYSQAAEEMRDRLDRALRAYSSEKAQREKAMDSTEEAMKAHREWLRMQAIQQTRMGSMVDQLADAAVNANARAMDMVRDAVPTIYSENANRAAFDVDKAVGYDTKFTLVDESTVRALIGSGVTDSPILREVRVPKVSRPKDYQWNRQEFTSAVTQGILQGESVPDIVKRTRSIFGMNRAAAFRAARTATTSAECAGRVSSYRRAERLGIDLMQEWMATVDPRTRPSHVALDGERVAVGEEFSNGLRFPGDPQGPGREVYNCRCTLVAAVDGIDQSAAARFSRLPDGMTYEGWRQRALDRLEAARQAGEPGVAHTPEPRYGEFRDLSYVDDNLGAHWGDGSDLDPQRMIMEDTGFDADRAEQVRKDVSSWVGQGYKKIRLEEGDYALTADRLEEFISASPKYEGTVYRGICVERDTADNILETLRDGGSIDNHGIASWATESDWATEFASMGGEEMNDPVGIVFQLDENRSGASIKHIADIDNDEVIAPEGVRYELSGSIETVVDPYEGKYVLAHVREAS